jgi:hypothetical protein
LEVVVTACLRPLLKGSFGIEVIHVAQNGHLKTGAFAGLELREAHTSDAHPSQGRFLIWSGASGSSE